jgi:uncharacterized metal-binding protein
MDGKSSSECAGGPKLIFACSGAADVGEISDRAARKMTKNGSGRMFCLAGIGGRVPGIMKKTEAASRILAIDGCELDCVKNCLEQSGFNRFDHLRVTDLGLQKGQAPANAENIATVAERGSAMLA